MRLKTGVRELLIFLALLGAGLASAGDLKFDLYSFMNRFENGKLVEQGVFAGRAPHISELENNRDSISTYPQFLDYLFSKTPELAGNFVLLHHSASLEFASPEHPRVLLFRDGVVYAISEHPDHGVQKVEMIEVDPGTFEARLAEIRFSSKGVEIERNPSSCVACHGQPAKLLWDPYDFWPQAFGSAVGSYLSPDEGEAYSKLRANASSSEILRRLELEDRIDIEDEQLTSFTQYVAQLNLPRWMREDLKRKDLGGWKWPLLSALSSCHISGYNPVHDPQKTRDSWLALFRPEEQTHVAPLYDRIFADNERAHRHFKNFQLNLSREYFADAPTKLPPILQRLDQHISDMTILRTVFEMTGINAANLSTSLFANDFDISNPSNLVLDFGTALYLERPDLFADVPFKVQSIAPNGASWIVGDCASIKRRSLEAERDFAPAGLWLSYQEVSSERPVISRCAKCHVEGLAADAPPIPFHDSRKLATLLRAPGSTLATKILDRVQRHDARQMPPGPARSLSPVEIEALRAFLEDLK